MCVCQKIVHFSHRLHYLGDIKIDVRKFDWSIKFGIIFQEKSLEDTASCALEKNVIGHLKNSNCTDYPIVGKMDQPNRLREGKKL